MKKYRNNSELMLLAAESLGYKTEKVIVNEKAAISRFGFFVKHNDKACFINEKCIFPNVHRWQSEVSGNKIITDSVLRKNKYTQIKTVYIDRKENLTQKEILKRIEAIDLPLIVKPPKGKDGEGILQADKKTQAVKIIRDLLDMGQSALVQPKVSGDEYRIFASMGNVYFIHKKRFPRIKGNGESTISELLKGAHYIDEHTFNKELAKHKYKNDDVLDRDVILKTHFTKKTDPDYLESENISPFLKEWTNKLCSDLSIQTIGIDAIIEGPLSKPKKITIIELNSNPGLYYLTKYYKNTELPLRIAKEILQKYFNQ